MAVLTAVASMAARNIPTITPAVTSMRPVLERFSGMTFVLLEKSDVDMPSFIFSPELIALPFIVDH
jgi:hypothetical protein